MNLNRKIFFTEIRNSLFGKMSQSQVDGLTDILNIWDHYYSHNSLEQLAYCLGTAYHEVGGRMQPVREGFKSTDEEAIAHVKRLHKRGKISRNYARRNPKTKKSYFGRGIVQITHYFNYKRMSKRLGIDFYNNPDLALETKNSAHIMFVGCLEGLFTGKKLSDYINDRKKNYKSARRVVNGMDKATTIAKYANKFERALKKAQSDKNVEFEQPKQDKEFNEKEVIQSSRRISFIHKIGRFIEWLGLGTATWKLSTLQKISDFVTDEKTLFLLVFGILSYGTIKWIKYLSLREYKEGRYQPSKEKETN